jgi:hypothetical protein
MIRKKKENREIVIDLTGPQGNAFVLLGMANDFGKQLGWDPKKRGDINAEMMAGDYENLLQVFDREFGSFVILER